MVDPRRGLLIAIEGVDGTGKSTLQRGLSRLWQSRGVLVSRFQEPTRTRWGRAARRLSRRDPWTAALAFTRDRAHQRPRVARALARGAVVLLDRSLFSTLAYQGTGLPRPERRRLERMQEDAAFWPDRVILLDLPVPSALERIRRRGTSKDPTERMGVVRRAARAYRAMARRRGWTVVSARQSRPALVREVDRRLFSWVRRRVRVSRARA